MNKEEIKQKFIENGLENYITIFEENHLLDENVLSSMTNEDYISVGVSLIGDRKKLLFLFQKNEIKTNSENILVNDVQQEESASNLYKNTITSQTSNKKEGNKKPIGLLIVLLICGVIGFFGFKSITGNNYSTKMKNAYEKIVSSGLEVENSIIKVHDVWSNAIDSRYKDFNNELKSLYNYDSDFKKSISKIEKDSDEISTLMRELTNPPSDYRDAYLKLNNCYEDYIKLVVMAKQPSGSLLTYTQNFNSIDASFTSSLKSLELYIK